MNPLFTSLQISDEPYLFLRIITLFTSLTNQSSPLQGELEGVGNYSHRSFPSVLHIHSSASNCCPSNRKSENLCNLWETLSKRDFS